MDPPTENHRHPAGVVGARAHCLAMPEPIVFPADERPDVELLWEGQWCPGELRTQTYRAGEWLCDVAVPPAG